MQMETAQHGGKLYSRLRSSALAMNLLRLYLQIPRPHFSAPRKIQDGQYIHESVFDDVEVYDQKYSPIAEWLDGKKWDRAELKDKIEYDPYASATKVFEKVKTGDFKVADLSVLTTLISSGEQFVCLHFLLVLIRV
jgi:hypothetical protein